MSVQILPRKYGLAVRSYLYNHTAVDARGKCAFWLCSPSCFKPVAVRTPQHYRIRPRGTLHHQLDIYLFCAVLSILGPSYSIHSSLDVSLNTEIRIFRAADSPVCSQGAQNTFLSQSASQIPIYCLPMHVLPRAPLRPPGLKVLDCLGLELGLR